MPVVILGTQMDAGNIKWRPKTSGLNDPGPDDQTLVIELSGRLSDLKGIEGNRLDAAKFRELCPIADQQWIPSEGIYACEIIDAGAKWVISVEFSAQT